MPKAQPLSVEIPFPGFYYSVYSEELDREQEQTAEHFAEREIEECIAEEIRIDAGEMSTLLDNSQDRNSAEQAVARAHVDMFETLASKYLGFPLRLEFEEMTSPRAYNFTTDRVFCAIPRAMVRKLFAMSKRDNHARLATKIAERFTSRDGFYSYYSNKLSDWLAKPILDWDHNEIGTLLRACLLIAGADENFMYEVCDAVCDGGLCEEFDHSVGWKKFKKLQEQARADKIETLKSEDPIRYRELVESGDLPFDPSAADPGNPSLPMPPRDSVPDLFDR